MKKLFILSLLVFLMAAAGFASENPGAVGALDQEEFTLEEMLHYALQDEWLAEGEYAALMESFNVSRPFSNIRQAELSHISMLMPLFEKYEIDLPERPEEAVIPDTLEETYQIGVDAEIANIAMYEKFLEDETLPEDVAAVFTRLMVGSESHLAAFQRQVDTSEGVRQGALGKGQSQGRGPGQRGMGNTSRFANGSGQRKGKGRNWNPGSFQDQF